MNFAERMKEIIRKNLVNKNGSSGQAPEKADESGRKSVLYLEISELEKAVENKFLIIGNEVYTSLMIKEHGAVRKNSIEIRDILLEIRNLEKLISEKELLLKQPD